MRRIRRHNHSDSKFPVECENYCLQYSRITVKLAILKWPPQSCCKKINHNSRLKITLKLYNTTKLLVQNLLAAQFLLYCLHKLSKIPEKNRVFDHNFQITKGKGDFIKSVDHVCVCKVIYLRVWNMKAGLPAVVEKVIRGHLK